MQGAAHPGGHVAQLAGTLPGRADQVGRRLEGTGCADHPAVVVVRDLPDGLEVLRWPVGQVGVQFRHDHDRAYTANKYRVAIGCGLGDLGRAQRARRAGPVFDDDGLAQVLGHGFPERASRHVGGSAGGEGNDESDRPVRIVLGGGWQGKCKRGEARGDPRLSRGHDTQRAGRAWEVDGHVVSCWNFPG
ncbi:hypothetical protein D3C85_1186260 [compost metagenome]